MTMTPEQFRDELHKANQPIRDKLDQLDVAIRGDGSDTPGLVHRVGLLEQTTATARKFVWTLAAATVGLLVSAGKRLIGLD